MGSNEHKYFAVIMFICSPDRFAGDWILFQILWRQIGSELIKKVCATFVDEYMQLKKDGHIKFYTEDEWCDICGKRGMERTSSSFKSKIRFPKKKETAYGYEDVLKKHDRSIIESYNLIETDTEIYITENVNNIIFVKK